MTDPELVQYALDQKIGLVGIGAMTRMIAKAYRVADALRAAGVPVVMGGPHVTECPDEALGRDGGPRHADTRRTDVGLRALKVLGLETFRRSSAARA